MFISVIFLLIAGAAGRGEALDLSFGVKAGSGLANLNGDNAPIYCEWKFSYSGGGFIELSLIDMIRVQPEVLVFYKGANYDDKIGNTGVYDFYYIDMPVLIKFYSMLPLPVKLNAFIGPYVGLNLVSKAKLLGIEFDNFVKHSDFGFLFGFGIDVWKFTLDVRTSFSLASIDKENNDDVKNNVLSLMVGYRIK